jgi:hypothetical protein
MTPAQFCTQCVQNVFIRKRLCKFNTIKQIHREDTKYAKKSGGQKQREKGILTNNESRKKSVVSHHLTQSQDGQQQQQEQSPTACNYTSKSKRRKWRDKPSKFILKENARNGR